jgi:hypothetical protein
MQRKVVYLNDWPIGEASTWAEVNALLADKRILFMAKPGKAEGPGGFYVHGSTLNGGQGEKRTLRRGTVGTAHILESKHDASVREIAEVLIAHYGERAASHASLQALKARQRGESRKVEVWERIADAVIKAMRAREELLERTTFIHRL